MKHAIFVFLFLVNAKSYTQTVETTYYDNQWLRKEIPAKKAKFSKTVTKHEDGRITTEITDLKKNEVVSSETFKGTEPYGIWKQRYNHGYRYLDYNFPLIYADSKCNDLPKIKVNDLFEDADSVGYKAPKLKSEYQTIHQFISRNLCYPSGAIAEGVQGTVYVGFTITASGQVENVEIKRGTHILLDKEAVRVMKLLVFETPPMIDGVPQTLNCIVLPIKFRMM